MSYAIKAAVGDTVFVSIVVARTGLATRPLGRAELKAYTAWDDGRPETELNFKLHRQATPKIVGLTAPAAAFLEGFSTCRTPS